jgi:protein-S-isoprenylcysteine O-methyltransferase Ste14
VFFLVFYWKMSEIILIHGNIWIVLVALGLYQLFLQIRLKNGLRFYEGAVKNLQVLTGIPALILLGVYLLDPDEIGFVFVYIPFFVHVAGVLLFNSAALVILWSHITLGNFWSGDLETRPNHKVIDTGPYHYVRHPLYASYLVMALGLFLMTGNWLVGNTLFLYFIAVAVRSWKEEEMLLERLGVPYAEYMSRTRRFFFW